MLMKSPHCYALEMIIQTTQKSNTPTRGIRCFGLKIDGLIHIQSHYLQTTESLL